MKSKLALLNQSPLALVIGPVAIAILMVGIAFGVWLAGGQSDVRKCEMAVPYAVVISARKVQDSILCRSVEVGNPVETLTWLDKDGRLIR